MSTIIPHARRWSNMQLMLVAIAAVGFGLLAGYLLLPRSEVTGIVHVEESDDAHAHAEGTIWTCSMHPQIQRDEPGDCPICGMDLVPLSSEAGDDPAVLTMTEAAVAMARVQTTVVGDAGAIQTAAGGQELKLSGRLAADERSSAVQTAHVPGRIERLFVTFEGEKIERGQRLAEVYSPELVTAQRELLEAGRFGGVNPALADAVRTRLRNLRIDDQTIKNIEAAGEPQTNFTLRADVAGVVLDKRVEVGDYVTTGQTLYTVTDLNQLWVLFDAYEEELDNIRVGDRVRFTTPSVPGREYTARVSFIDPILDAGSRTARVRAEVANSGGRLRPEMFVEGTVLTRPRSGAAQASGNGNQSLLVPATAVMWTGERSVVYVEVPDAAVPSYRFQEVTLGERINDYYVVTEGLVPGERVVTQGAFSIDAAAQLNNQFSMMNRDVVIRGREAEAVTFRALPNYRSETPPAFELQLLNVAKAYAPLPEALVVEDLVAAKRTVTGFAARLTEVDMNLIEGDAHLYWMEQLDAMQAHATALLAADELAAARTEFAFLSQALINTLTAFGYAGETLYVQHCPMAFNNEGANWLSEKAEIRNPYFGDAMLSCGRVLDKL